MDRPQFDLDGRGRHPVRYVAERHRRSGTAGRHASRRGGQRLRKRFRRNGSAADHRGQSKPAGGARRDERPRSEHPGDRGNRGALRRDVGPGRHRDVRLRRRLGNGITSDPVHHPAADHQLERPDEPVRRRCPVRRHLDGIRSRHDHVVWPASHFGNAASPAEPGVAAGPGWRCVHGDRFVDVLNIGNTSWREGQFAVASRLPQEGYCAPTQCPLGISFTPGLPRTALVHGIVSW